jgi:putative FmdB family regulatory protein
VPLYEFRCRRCGHEFEKLVGAAAPVPACPACGAKKAERKFSVFGSRSGGTFTGSGGGGCSSCSSGKCSTCH